MKTLLRNTLAVAMLAIATQASAQITFYEREGFQGQSFTTERRVGNFDRFGFNDRASSVVVTRSRWEVCEDVRFTGRCVVLRRGQYDSLAAMGLNNRVSSVREVSRSARISDDRYAPAPVVTRDDRADGQITFYEREGFEGRSFSTERQVDNFDGSGFNDRASSVVVVGERWEVCENARFGGRCVVLRPGRYGSLAEMGLNDRISSVRTVGGNSRIDDRRYAPPPVAVRDDGQITFYEREGFEGRSFTTERPIDNFDGNGFNDRASSVVVAGDRWEVCENARFGGRCVVLRPGRYGSLAEMGLNDRISSVRTVGGNSRIDDRRYAPAPRSGYDGGYAPAPAQAYDYRRRDHERLYDAEVTSVRAVVGTPEQHCWVEREQVAPERSRANVPAAIAGGLIGGILGHQVGGGSGKDIATVGGVVAGAAIGANIGRSVQSGQTQDVQRCNNVSSQARPDYWDVTYHFRGQDYRVQMIAPPGPTVTVNERGEPRA